MLWLPPSEYSVLVLTLNPELHHGLRIHLRLNGLLSDAKGLVLVVLFL